MPDFASTISAVASNAGYGSADFQRYYSQIPQFAQAWDQTVDQFKAEGNAASLPLAADTWVKTFVQIGQANPSLATDIPSLVNTTQQFISTSQTIAGAVQTVSGLLSAAKKGGDYEDAQAAITAINAVVGTAVTIAAATAPATYGVGALIAAAIAITFELLELFGAFGKPTPPPVATVCGMDLNFKPTVVIGCAFAYCADQSIAVAPGADGWRTFPTGDSLWFQRPGASAWQVALNGDNLATFKWKNVTWSSRCYTAVDYNNTKQWLRPIDMAFPQYAWLEKLPAAGATSAQLSWPAAVVDFRAALFMAWKGAKANAFNLAPVLDDANVLLTVLQYWNKAHSDSSYFDLNPDDFFVDPYVQYHSRPGNPVGAKPSFLVDHFAHFDPLTSGSTPGYVGGGRIRVNTGPLHNPPMTAGAVKVAHLQLASGSRATAASGGSTTSTVVKSVAVAAGVGVASAVGYSYYTGESLASLFGGSMTLGQLFEDRQRHSGEKTALALLGVGALGFAAYSLLRGSSKKWTPTTVIPSGATYAYAINNPIPEAITAIQAAAAQEGVVVAVPGQPPPAGWPVDDGYGNTAIRIYGKNAGIQFTTMDNSKAWLLAS